MLKQLQKALNEKVDLNNLLDPEIIKLSQELDQYIVADMKERNGRNEY